MPLQLATFERTCGLGQKPGQTADFRKPARTKAKKEDVSGETRTYGNPKHKSLSNYVGTSYPTHHLQMVIPFSLGLCGPGPHLTQGSTPLW